MKKFEEFKSKDQIFWSNIKFVSERLKYSTAGKIKIYTINDLNELEKKFDIEIPFKDEIISYTTKRANCLNNQVQKYLLNKASISKFYKRFIKKNNPKSKIIMNKQKKDKKHPSYLSNLVSFNCEKILGIENFNNDPQKLSVIINNKKISKVFSRRFDGEIYKDNNLIAVWEVKEYYGTTTFGSRVADGIYETILDGYEINQSQSKIKHFLFVDDKFTWWKLGKSYLCRMIDILNMGLVDEIFFGKEVISEWPKRLESIKKEYF